MERDKILDEIKSKGHKFADNVQKVISNCSIPCKFSGAPWMPFITFEADPEKKYKVYREQFYTELIRRKVFLQPYHHGYIAYRHSMKDLDYAVGAIEESLKAVEKKG